MGERSHYIQWNPLYERIQKYKDIDAMDIIYLVVAICKDMGSDKEELMLRELISDECELNLPINLILPIKVILQTPGLLSGIKRYMSLLIFPR